MAITEERDFEYSERYESLAPKQKEIVDAWAELYEEQGKEPKNVDVVEKADSDPSYVSEVLTEHKDVARARVEQKENTREEGEVKTEGDPFNGQIPKEQSFQTVQDRPVKQTSQPQDDETDEEAYSYTFTKEEVETIVVDEELPESLHSELKRELIQRVFGD